jgi:hypothetical protein
MVAAWRFLFDFRAATFLEGSADRHAPTIHDKG